ncbi:SRPBCC domain-containing protein [Flavobacterium sp.]|uniref:SRPBCC domain-containing protein n=1 Tax=Flavobacterium sp. TaxID=239 RepID=UPI0028BD228A|nr:SRPBCC domain-containing protein [Flavobacterium sp.]
MNTDKLQIKVAMQVQKPMHEVFEAIVNPEKMSNYFISESTGRMEEGKNLIWKFPEFDLKFPVRVGKIELNKYVSFYWEDSGEEHSVEISLSESLNGSTLVSITEKEMENNEAGLKWLSGNSFGWSNFLACLKAYLEYGINLRKGSFDFMNK